MDALARLGWDDVLAASFAAIAADGDAPARVTAQHRGSYAVLAADGARTVAPAGRLRHVALGAQDLPAVGDWVAVRDDVARALVPRRNAVRRRDTGLHDAQVLAANVDDVFVVAPLHRDLGPIALRIQQYVALAHDSGADPLLLLTKADLCPDVRAQVTRAARAAPGVDVHVTSAVSGDGLGALADRLARGRTAVLLGPSGAGKSTLINALTDAALVTRELDEFGEGRHASVRRELVPLATGGCVIDTPGLRNVDAWLADDVLAAAYPEIARLARECRFRDCTHAAEPGCAVNAAVADGSLDAERLSGLRKLEREAAVTRRQPHEQKALYRRIGRGSRSGRTRG